MKDNNEQEEDRAVGIDYSAEEAEQMGAFVEDVLSFEDVRESIDDFESESEK
jgi:hypothetical protein